MAAKRVTLDQIRSFCETLPEMNEVEAWGHPTFRAGKKMFAAAGHDDAVRGKPTLGLRMTFERQDQLLKDPRFYPTPYAAHQGWVSIRLKDLRGLHEARVLLIEAYRTVALKRMLRELNISGTRPE